jgi:excisionase family DNA binding protein
MNTAARPEIAGKAQPFLYGIADAGRMLGISRSTVWLMIKSGKLEVVHIGRRTLVKNTSLQKIAAEGDQPMETKKSPGLRSGAKELSYDDTSSSQNQT